ncbi:MAG: hypothetical protein ABIP29_08550, partial [Candidatus Eisenbacteria bacterium]
NNILWSNDGQRIVFGRLVGSKGWLIYMKAANGSGADSLVFQGPSLFAYPLSWSRDGKWLVAQVADSAGSYDLWRIPMDGQGKPEPYQVTPVTETGASISPDGHWLAYAAQENGKPAIYVQSFPQPGSKYQVVVENGLGCKWGDKGDELLVFTSKLEIYSVPVTTTDGVQQGTPRRLFGLPPATFLLDAERGEQRFLCGKPDDSFRGAALEVVFGWPQLLGKK